jgi:predicted RNase H-like HicB family nuclease
MRQAVIYQDEDGGWVAEVPSLPGCISQGDTREEALLNIADAAELWIESMHELGEPIPPASGHVEVVPINIRAA